MPCIFCRSALIDDVMDRAEAALGSLSRVCAVNERIEGVREGAEQRRESGAVAGKAGSHQPWNIGIKTNLACVRKNRLLGPCDMVVGVKRRTVPDFGF